MVKKLIYLFFSFTISGFSCFGSYNPIDSIQKVLRKLDVFDEEAVASAHKMVEFGKKLDTLGGTRLGYDWLAYIYMNRGDLQKALQNADSMMLYAGKMNSREEIHYAYGFKIRMYTRVFNFKEALKYSEKALQLAENMNSVEQLRISYDWLTFIHRSFNQYDQAYKYAALLLSYSISPGDICYAYECFLNIAIMAEEYDKAIEFGNKILEQAKKFNLQDTIRFAYQKLISIQSDRGNYNEALQYADQMLGWAEQGNSAKNIYYTYNTIIRIYECMPDYNKALRIANKMLQWARQSDSLEVIKLCYDSNEPFLSRRSHKDILSYFFDRAKIDEEIGNKKQISYNYFLIGNIYIDLNNSSKALYYFNKAFDGFKEIDDKWQIAGVYNCMGIVYSNEGEYDKSFDYYKKSLKIYENPMDFNNTSVIYNNIGNHYLGKGNPIAIKYYRKALKMARVLNYQNTLALIYNSLGEYYLYWGNTDSSLFYLKKSLKISEDHKYSDKIRDNLRLLSDLYAKQKQYDKAYKYQLLYKHINDSLFNEQSISNVVQLDMQHKYDVENKRHTIELLQKEKDIKVNRLILLIIFLILIFASGLVYLWYRSKTKQEKLNIERLSIESRLLTHELQYKDKELSTKISHLINKNKLISDVSEELLKFRQKFKMDDQQTIEEIAKELKFNINKEFWEEFEYRFKQVHNDFYRNLSKNFPNLTSNELKLCAFLRLNMSSKDISTVTHQSVNSIEVARARLRRKLDLSSAGINLVDFLSKF